MTSIGMISVKRMSATQTGRRGGPGTATLPAAGVRQRSPKKLLLALLRRSQAGHAWPASTTAIIQERGRVDVITLRQCPARRSAGPPARPPPTDASAKPTFISASPSRGGAPAATPRRRPRVSPRPVMAKAARRRAPRARTKDENQVAGSTVAEVRRTRGPRTRRSPADKRRSGS